MLRRPPSSTRTDPLFPYTPLFRSVSLAALAAGGPASDHHIGSGARARERPPCSIRCASPPEVPVSGGQRRIVDDEAVFHVAALHRSEEHTSELQSLMRISYAVFCLKKKKKIISRQTQNHNQY